MVVLHPKLTGITGIILKLDTNFNASCTGTQFFKKERTNFFLFSTREFQTLISFGNIAFDRQLICKKTYSVLIRELESNSPTVYGSFYAHRSQKCKKDCQLKQLFALSGSVGIKAAHDADEIDPSRVHFFGFCFVRQELIVLLVAAVCIWRLV